MRSLFAGAALAAFAAAWLPFADARSLFAWPPALAYTALMAALAAATAVRRADAPLWAHAAAALLGAAALLHALAEITQAGGGCWLLLASVWLQVWHVSARLTAAGGAAGAAARFAAPALFGCSLLLAWEVITRGAGVSPVLLPPPSAIFLRLASDTAVLAADFQQTVLKAALIGYLAGCLSGAAAAAAVDRSPFLRRGLLPLGHFISALPIIGIAPIMVMWFGFDWQSKAAVVVVMTFFPMLVNTLAGLRDHSAIERDLMSTYAAGYRQRLIKLSLPAALPFIFNALKINSTLALIGAIVAEFFGTPIVGMGFRISTEVGRMNLDMVWAEIAVAALTGTAFYGILTLLERKAIFWHPSVRNV